MRRRLAHVADIAPLININGPLMKKLYDFSARAFKPGESTGPWFIERWICGLGPLELESMFTAGLHGSEW